MAVSGPVRDLKCTYENRIYKPLSCKWAVPTDPHGVIQHYIVLITHKNETIYSKTTKHRFILSQDYLQPSAIYNVSVKAVTHVEGVPATTNIVFEDISPQKNVSQEIGIGY